MFSTRFVSLTDAFKQAQNAFLGSCAIKKHNVPPFVLNVHLFRLYAKFVIEDVFIHRFTAMS